MFTFPNSARMPERTVWSQGAEVKCLKSQSTWEATAFDFSLTETTDGKRFRKGVSCRQSARKPTELFVLEALRQALEVYRKSFWETGKLKLI